MKKVIIMALIMAGLSTASFAQTTPQVKNSPAKTTVTKKHHKRKHDSKTVHLHKKATKVTGNSTASATPKKAVTTSTTASVKKASTSKMHH